MGDHKLNDEVLDAVSGGVQNISMSDTNIAGDQVVVDNSININGGITKNQAEGDIVTGIKNTNDVTTTVTKDLDVNVDATGVDVL